MDSAIGVLCARVKVEEKWLIEMLAGAGIPARPFPPTAAPLPIGPVPTGPLATSVAGGVAAEVSGVAIDRLADRVVAGALLPTLRATGVRVFDAGHAATGNRLTVASILAAAGIPRPATMLACSEESGLAAVRELGCPVTLMPLDGGIDEIALADRDIAEAVLEHREVLGSSVAAVALVQAGVRAALPVTEVLVVGGRAIADGASLEALELARATATVLNASILGVTIAVTAGGPVVWDVQATPRFRDLLATEQDAIASAFVALIQGSSQPRTTGTLLWNAELRGEVTGDVVLSA
jgi:glutathione synthase/RimK-type ligase-like ATP-grasp enzyme